jgi:polysaccharide pyruvyl transferase WcaK-like protein
LRLIGYWIKLAMWAVVFWVARLKGAKVVIVGAGIGPLRYPISRWISRLALTACGSIGLRDGASAKTLVDLSSTFRYELGFDLAALHSRHLPVAEENKWKGRKALAISACCLAEFLGGQKLNDRYWWALADALTIFSLEQPVRIVFLSLFTGESSESDDAVADLIAARLPHDLPVDRRSYNGCVEELSAEFERSDWFLCTKYHAALAAYLWGCNFAVITYNRKVSDLADEIGLPLDRRARADMPLPVEVWLEVLRSFAKGNPGGHLLDRHEAKRRARLAVIRVLETAAAQFPNRYAACDV